MSESSVAMVTLLLEINIACVGPYHIELTFSFHMVAHKSFTNEHHHPVSLRVRTEARALAYAFGFL